MRRISNQGFWGKVKAHPDKQEVEKIYSVFDETLQFSTVAESNEYLLEKVVPAQQTAARINGCRSPQSVAVYYKDVSEVITQTVGNRVEWVNMAKAPTKVQRRYWRRIAGLAASYARRKACHPLKHGFVCYCK